MVVVVVVVLRGATVDSIEEQAVFITLLMIIAEVVEEKDGRNRK